MNLTVLLLAIVGIYVGGNWVVAGASRLARSYGVPHLIVGLTVISFVTTAPELLIAIRASAIDADGLVLGMVTGSNITNIGLVLGLSGLIAGSLPIATGLVKRGVPIVVGLLALGYGLMFLPQITWQIGIVMIIVFFVFSAYMLRIMNADDQIQVLRTQEMAAVSPMQTDDKLLEEDEEVVEREVKEHINRPFEFVRAVLGIIILIFCADAIVQGALAIVEQIGANQVVLGATLIALATSAPELIAVFAAASSGRPDVAFGNVIGASVTNIMLVLGMASLAGPITIAAQVRIYEYPVMLGLLVYMIFVALDGQLSRFEAGLYTLAYAAFIAGFFILPIY